MKVIAKQKEKTEILSGVLLKHVFCGKHNKDEYLEEAYEIVTIIDGIKVRSIVADLVEEYYLERLKNDHFSNFEEISKIVADEYLNAISKI